MHAKAANEILVIFYKLLQKELWRIVNYIKMQYAVLKFKSLLINLRASLISLLFFFFQFRNQYDNDVTIWSPQVWFFWLKKTNLFVVVVRLRLRETVSVTV